MGRRAGGPKLRKRDKQPYSVRFTLHGRERELSTGTHDAGAAEIRARELWFSESRDRRTPERQRRQVFGLPPIVRAPAARGVYICWCEALPNYVKIGWSSHVRNRLRLLRTGLPGRLYLLAYLPG